MGRDHPKVGRKQMSYREENGQVILTMSREDHMCLMFEMKRRVEIVGDGLRCFLNRLNEGDPGYTPYKVDPPPGACW
jgi:hypothetical protein